MATTFSALSTKTAQHMQLDAGVIAIGDIGDLAALDIKNKLKGNPELFVGATKGGATFTATPEIRDLLDGIDGVRGAYKSTQVIDTWEATLKTTITEMTKANIEKAIASHKVGTSKGGYNSVTAEVGLINEGKFFDVHWIGTTVGGTKPMIIKLKNALNVSGFNFTAEDKATGSVEVEFKAHFDLAAPNTVPFEIYIPTELAAMAAHTEELKKDK